MNTLRNRPFVLILVALLILLALSGVAYALGRAFGYIPGIGVVELDSPLRVLAGPVTVKQQGISVTVSKVVADSTRTFISYRMDGIPPVGNGIPACLAMPEMRLPDGGRLEITRSGGVGIPANATHYEAEYVYSPVPVGLNQVTFVLSCTLPEQVDSENWEMPLDLVPAPAGYATPAIEIPTILESAENKSGLHLERVLELAGSYILIGKFTDAGDLGGPLSMSTASDSEYLPRIEDANGNPVSFKVREDARPDPDWDVAYYWAYEIPKPVAGPLKITVDSIDIRMHHSAQIPFDAGDHPQVGQEWDLNQTVGLGSSEFVVDSVAFLGDGYTFKLSSENLPEGVTPDLEIVDRSSSPYQFDNIDTTQAPSGNKVLYTITLTTQSPPPTGNLTVNWGLDEFIPHPGPWSLVWTPSPTNP